MLVGEALLRMLPVLISRTQNVGSFGTTTVVCFGDSVTQGVGLRAEDAWPAQLQTDLASLPPPTVRVWNAGTAGASSEYIQKSAIPNLGFALHQTHPVAVVLLGTNEFIEWRAFGDEVTRSGGLEISRPAGMQSGPALWRIFTWALGSVRGDQPRVVLDPARKTRFRKNIQWLRDETLSHQGHIWLATYVLPGPADEATPDRLRTSLSITRPGNELINQEIRSVAAELGIPVIDLEVDVPVAPTWNAEEFQDNIHPTAPLMRRIATTIRRRLTEAGDLPADLRR